MRREDSMFGLDYLLAVLLLQGAEISNFNDARLIPGWHALVGKPLIQLALAGEILDSREVRYVLAKPDEFVSDLRMLQRRAHDLNQAPRLADAARFPERTIVNELLLLNRAYRQHLENCLPLYPNNVELRAARDEVELLYQVWDSVRDARCEYYYVHIRRQALKRLHDLMGETDYQNANLPPHVPLWRFAYVR
jgi:hypothetical protein